MQLLLIRNGVIYQMIGKVVQTIYIRYDELFNISINMMLPGKISEESGSILFFQNMFLKTEQEANFQLILDEDDLFFFQIGK